MMRMPWQLVLAIFWMGMFVEAAIGNAVGRHSSADGLLGDVVVMGFLAVWAKRSWRPTDNGERR